MDPPSRTAQSVAGSILLLSYDPIFGALVPPDAAALSSWLLQATPGLTWKSLTLLDHPLGRAYQRWLEKQTTPGMSIHHGVRKRWIEEKVRAAVAAGAQQVVVLGAGYDTLAYRLHHVYPVVQWIEIDRAATQAVKRQVLTQKGRMAANMTLVPADFSRQSPAELLATLPAYQPDLPTTFIAEGLLMYLTGAEVGTLLQALHSQSNSNSSLTGTVLAPRSDGRLALQGASPLVGLALHMVGEPFRWGAGQAELPGFLQAQGFRLVEVAHVRELLPHYLPEPLTAEQARTLTLPEGEYLFRAERL
jgi:methyltransferase (TIGR00027 family)